MEVGRCIALYQPHIVCLCVVEGLLVVESVNFKYGHNNEEERVGARLPCAYPLLFTSAS
mgnify:FL=1